MPHLEHMALIVVAVTSGAYVGVGQNTKMKTRKQSLLGLYLHGVGLRLTPAGLHALSPAMISVCVANTSAFFIPSTTRSTTTDSA